MKMLDTDRAKKPRECRKLGVDFRECEKLSHAAVADL